MSKVPFEILKDVEFFDIAYRGKTAFTFDPQELEGKTWRQASEILGQHMPGGLYSYHLKFKNKKETHSGKIKSITKDLLNKKESSMLDTETKKTIDLLASQVKKIQESKSDITIDTLLAVTKSSYETQITFLNSQLSFKEQLVNKLENKIEEYEKELQDQDLELQELKSSSGLNQYLKVAMDLIQAKAGKMEKIQDLSASQVSDIPPQILQILGVVNWSEVNENLINEIVNYLSMFINKLPLKGA